MTDEEQVRENAVDYIESQINIVDDSQNDFLETVNQEHRVSEWMFENVSTVSRPRRAKYHARIDRFLTNGIIIVGVLLFAVLLIAFMG